MKDNGCKAERGTVEDVTRHSSQPRKTRAWPCSWCQISFSQSHVTNPACTTHIPTKHWCLVYSTAWLGGKRCLRLALNLRNTFSEEHRQNNQRLTVLLCPSCCFPLRWSSNLTAFWDGAWGHVTKKEHKGGWSCTRRLALLGALLRQEENDFPTSLFLCSWPRPSACLLSRFFSSAAEPI